jgi:hypothetical protein
VTFTGSRQLNVGLNSSRSHNPTDVGVELGGMTEQAPPVSELPEPEPLSGNDATKAEDVSAIATLVDCRREAHMCVCTGGARIWRYGSEASVQQGPHIA